MTPEQLKKLPNPNNIPEDKLKILVGQYEDWVSHPNTHQLVRLLQERKQYYVDSLMDHILRTSDKEIEDRHRAAISTIETVFRFVTEPALFIEHTTKKTQ